MKNLLLSILCSTLATLLHAETTPIPETIVADGFSVTYKIDAPAQWNVSVLDNKTRICYKRQSENAMGDFNVIKVSIAAKLLTEKDRKIADSMIRKDIPKFHKKTFGDRQSLLFEKKPVFESKIGSVFFYKSRFDEWRETQRGRNRPFDTSRLFLSYAAFILPKDYKTNGYAYIVTGIEMNPEYTKIPSTNPRLLDIFQGILTGVTENPDTKAK
ncbi:hypothetical protein M2103_001616 [Ereboglobus sp. PH5-5]|uniref:hypothetical protein n=1 Tax=unclassified Ereboglobus TaxID=2626932 RepID=UPI0024065132|nr:MULTISPECIES: hypothetical protein [unclassified Ereboglobus]MDF9826708.1 hypothetical protein [Ereboglobus sp. PH5-10]MDF9833392.1 hypothetical protein [Ereboglobus sp. PH5-5]